MVPWVSAPPVLVGLSFRLAAVPYLALPTSGMTRCGTRTDPKAKEQDPGDKQQERKNKFKSKIKDKSSGREEAAESEDRRAAERAAAERVTLTSTATAAGVRHDRGGH